MPCCVLLKNEDEVIIVKSEWCQQLNGAANRMHGCCPSTVIKIFYSPDKTKRADFGLQTMRTFNAARMAFYYGYVVKICGTYGFTL